MSGVQNDIELFLKFLPHSATEDSVWAHFKKGARTMKKVRLSMNKETGECKGIGWLTVREEEDAKRLVDEWNKAPNCEMDGRNVEISYVADAAASTNWKPSGVAVAGSGFKCRFGLTCKRVDCTFSHPAEWDPKSTHNQQGDTRFDRQCNYAENCSRADCKFQHPEGRSGLQAAIGWKIRNCKLGWNCNFAACIYTHPDGRQLDYNEDTSSSSKPAKESQEKGAKSSKSTVGDNAAKAFDDITAATKKKKKERIAEPGGTPKHC